MTPPPNPKDQPRQPVVNRPELQQYSGPIPPPVRLEQYNKIVPGAAERILKMAAGYAIKLNQPIAASLISALGIGSLVGTFIYGTRSRRIERDSRLK